MSAEGEDGYTGTALLVREETEFEVQVELRGHFQLTDERDARTTGRPSCQSRNYAPTANPTLRTSVGAIST